MVKRSAERQVLFLGRAVLHSTAGRQRVVSDAGHHPGLGALLIIPVASHRNVLASPGFTSYDRVLTTGFRRVAGCWHSI